MACMHHQVYNIFDLSLSLLKSIEKVNGGRGGEWVRKDGGREARRENTPSPFLLLPPYSWNLPPHISSFIYFTSQVLGKL